MIVVGNLSVCLGILIFFFMINVVIYMAWKKLDALSVGQMLIIDVVSIDQHKHRKQQKKRREKNASHPRLARGRLAGIPCETIRGSLASCVSISMLCPQPTPI